MADSSCRVVATAVAVSQPVVGFQAYVEHQKDGFKCKGNMPIEDAVRRLWHRCARHQNDPNRVRLEDAC